jgi:hypothetical protein
MRLPNPNDLKTFSGGACKVLLALTIEPTANNSRVATLTGYSTRQVRTLRKEVEECDLAEAQAQSSDLDANQTRSYQSLVAFGFDNATARNVAHEYHANVVAAGLRYVKKCSGLANPRGLLISWLKANCLETYPDTAHDGHAMFWGE